MDKSFRLFPEQASDAAERLDSLYFFLVGTTVFFTTLIFLLIVYFALRYRRGTRADRRNAPTFHLGLELGWTFIPLVITMVSFAWGARLFVRSVRTPPDAMPIFVVAKQWMWKVHHTEGRREINQLHVPVGRPVVLRMISEDVIHSFFVPAFRLKQDVLPGRYTHLWFRATKPGIYHLFCAEYCGTSHSLMRGQVVVQTQEEYAQWLAEEQVESLAVVGHRLFERLRCDSCHQAASSDKGPALAGLFVSPVKLESGQRVTRDMAYFRKAIYDPRAHIVAGYKPLMPSYSPQQALPGSSVSEEGLLALVAYVQSLSERPDSETPAP